MKIAAFNIQKFGQKKVSDAIILNHLVQVKTHNKNTWCFDFCFGKMGVKQILA